MDDVNNMNKSKATTEQSSVGVANETTRAGMDRRTMLKAAVVAGTIAGTWVAPRIETLGFAPAFALGTPCTHENPATNDLHSNQGANTDTSPGLASCGKGSFGDSGNSMVDRITIPSPVPGCAKVVVRITTTDEANCTNPQDKNPDIGGFAVVIDNSPGQTPAGCSTCSLVKATIYADPQNTTVIDEFFQTVSTTCGTGIKIETGNGTTGGSGVHHANLCSQSSAHLAVTITCTTTGAC